MTGAVLGRVADPEALDRCGGARGRVRVRVPRQWLLEQAEVELCLPRHVTCDRCGGGGCDGCGRSGAYRLAQPPERRRVRLTLPERPEGAVVRLGHPLPEGALEQLLVELRPGERPSANVSRLGLALAARVPPGGEPRRGPFVAVAVLALIVALALLASWL